MSKESSLLEQDNLSLKWAGISLLGVGIVIAILIVIFGSMDAIRQRQVVTQSTQVVRQFQMQNQGEVENLFNLTFENCASEVKTKQMEKDSANIGRNWSPLHCQAAERAFARLNKSALSDFPSTAYIRVHGENVEFLQASGDYFMSQPLNQISGFNQREDLQAYLFQHKDIRRWNNFISYMQQRQVIVPVEQNGQTIGYMFLGVIEK